ncbi:hypothetical protein KPL76_00230 [Subtercola sp. PAMC28395]|uniref:hypothetical protein n=1 Tax=Subtercola sp. PAMC28395 TaxID=2846775 RepID=UPI001C0D77A3|nr:hypothetical protein [Subtercola sp. PAMC28395]QWT23921.1 hypothetical protein KPL76_00230 [Subtercola sp. PAMC28395]
MNATAATTIDATQPHSVYAATPWSADVWFLAHDGRCIGWIRRYFEGDYEFFGVYTYGCDRQGLRVWVASERSLTGAAAYMAAHVTELLDRSRSLGPDPVNPLGLHERR